MHFFSQSSPNKSSSKSLIEQEITLITLNIWGGSILDPFLTFIKNHQEIDVFCFQEVYSNAPERISTDNTPVCLNINERIAELLPNHNTHFKPMVPKVEGIYGISIFIKKNFIIEDEGTFEIHPNPTYIGKGPTHPRILQWIRFAANEKRYTVINLHGLWNGKGKADSPERIAQSQKIKEFLSSIETPVILCGDFNLTPDTQSIRLLEDALRNEIRVHNIQSTRSRFYTKPIRYADYIFTSSIDTIAFEVMNEEISDHLPLLIRFK